ncbi:MAG: alpha/beta hydrolase [Bacteroidota bacterium]
MNKPNLVIVHSFPGNSKMLDGYYKFLGDYFNVHPIDLPGFNVDIPPLKKIQIENYVKYTEKVLQNLPFSRYVLAGLSFGFCVVNRCKVDDRCRSKIALFPYLNANYLQKMPTRKERFLLRFIRYLHLHRFVYTSTWFRNILIEKIPKRSLDIMLKSMDPYTFFELLHRIIHYKEEPIFSDHPYVLIVNKEDDTVNGKKIIEQFKELPKASIIFTDMPHHPGNPSKSYFKKYIPDDDIKKILRFIEAESDG